METYERSWRMVAVAAGALGLLLSLGSVPVPGLVTLAVGGGVITWAVHERDRQTRHAEPAFGAYVPRVLLGAALAPAVAGWTVAIGGYGLLLVSLLAAASPPVRNLVMDTVLAGTTGPEGSAPGVSKAPDAGRRTPTAEAAGEHSIRLQSDEEVIRLWRASYGATQGTRSAAELHAAMVVRRCCLNELERRYPAAFSTWIVGARAAGDPTPHLRSAPRVRPDQ